MTQVLEQRATVYRRENGIFVVGAQELDDRLDVGGPPYIHLPADATASQLGAAVARALSENRQGVVMADEEIAVRTWQPLLSLAGARTNSEFHTGLTAVDVEATRGRCRVVELENGGSTGGMVRLEPAVVVDATSLEDLGQAIPETLGS
jgi:hypothetical protein